MEQWLHNWRGAVLVAAAVVTGCVLLAIDDPGGNAGNTVSAAASAEPATTTATTAKPGTATTVNSGTATTAKSGTTTTAKAGTAPATAATTTTPAVARAEVKLGSKGSDVTYLQQRLTTLNYSPGPADGAFGTATNTAVLAFQKAQGLTADGVVGAKTWAALDAAK